MSISYFRALQFSSPLKAHLRILHKIPNPVKRSFSTNLRHTNQLNSYNRNIAGVFHLNRNNFNLFENNNSNGVTSQQTRHKNRYSGFYDPTPKKKSAFHKFYIALLMSGFFVTSFTSIWAWLDNVEAASLSPSTPETEEGEKAEDEEKDKEKDEEKEVVAEKPKKKRIGFRERKFIEYENRIRDYSTPDKIFRYFATKKVVTDQEVCMTPDDFVRSVTPNNRQDENLGLDKFERFDPKVDKLESSFDPSSIFLRFGHNGLISFSDYMFLLVILSTPPRSIEIAFKMFDYNGDGILDLEEFERVTEVLRSNSHVGMRHRDHLVTGNTIKSINTGLTKFFFGENLDKKLTVEKFLDFQKQLLFEILKIEYDRYDKKDNGNISERDFAHSIIVYTGHTFAKRAKLLKKIRKSSFQAPGISFTDYQSFYKVLKHVNDIDVALVFYNVAGASIDKKTLKHVAKTVAHVELSDHLIDVVFLIFDENDDGELSHREFVSVMKRRLMRGLQKPRDTGLLKIVAAAWQCAKMQIPLMTPDDS